MHSVWRAFFIVGILAMAVAGLASAQTINFNLFVSANGQTSKVPNDSQINFSAGANQVVVTATYIGTSQATITQPPANWLLGSTQFAVTVPTSENFPLVLGSGQTLTFTITYTPSSSSVQANAQLQVPFTEPGATGTITSFITLALAGVAPAVTLSYALAPNNNEVLLHSGDTIPFAPTQLNTTSTGVLQITNTGSGAAQITGITPPPSTSPFQLSGVPLATTSVPFPLPANGGANSTLTMPMSYKPTKVGTDTATITVTFKDGTTDTINLSGSGATSTFTYSVLSADSTSTPVSPGGTITLPPVPVATTGTTTASSSVIVQVKNTGNADGVINSINAGPSPPFGVTGAPVTPPTLKPGDSENFSVTYTPTQIGPQVGTLLVGNDTFKLSGTGNGPQLTFGYSSGGTTVSIGTSGQVVFPTIAVSKSETVDFTVTNSGTSTTTISLVSTLPPFSVPLVPPTALTAGQSTKFPITFTPTAVGPATGTLIVNGISVALVGGGTAPPSLPSYTISGPSGNIQPASQVPVTLTLANSYPVTLNGVLTLTTSGNLGTDPAVQFSTGSSAGNRTVNFVIPAGSTSANFAGQGTQIFLQTGTVAETVTLAPTFVTTGGVDLTPSSPPTLQFTVGSLAPVLESASITGETATGFSLVIIGYSTTRSLTSLSVTFTAATGFTLAATQSTLDLSGSANVWFQSAGSQGFGGQFQVSIPYNLTGTVPKGNTPIQAIASVSATIGNSVGTSNPVTVKLQ